MGKAHPTEPAVEWLFLGVNTLVSPEIRHPIKALLTEITAVRILSCMNTHVFPEIRLVIKALNTLVAVEWLFAGVNKLV